MRRKLMRKMDVLILGIFATVASLQETLRKHGLILLACPTIAQPSSAATQPSK